MLVFVFILAATDKAITNSNGIVVLCALLSGILFARQASISFLCILKIISSTKLDILDATLSNAPV